MAALFATALIAGSFVHVNRFSLHCTFRDRLIRAYLGASNRRRNPHPFTGFDADDNLRMHQLTAKECATAGLVELQLPLHVINVALNVVSGAELAWQQRKAASFTISPLHCGSSIKVDGNSIGYRDSRLYYGGRQPTARAQQGNIPLKDWYGRPITLGTAVTISGAAVSPNQGYHSNPILAFLLTFFNVRVGAWVGNPADRNTFTSLSPRCAFWVLLREAFGMTDESSSFLYLSDGGHFENLAIYEMVKRRCRAIIACDAGCDPDSFFDDLGNVIRKIRTDLGYDVTFGEDFKIKSRSADPAATHFILGTVHYKSRPGEPFDKDEDGLIFYVKSSFVEQKGPRDVCNYAASNMTFPHESTADQFFSESQFESYRALGEYIGQKLCSTLGTAPARQTNEVPKADARTFINLWTQQTS
jgi:hypothetical protein